MPNFSATCRGLISRPTSIISTGSINITSLGLQPVRRLSRVHFHSLIALNVQTQNWTYFRYSCCSVSRQWTDGSTIPMPRGRARTPTYGTHFVWGIEGGKGAKGKIVEFQIRQTASSVAYRRPLRIAVTSGRICRSARDFRYSCPHGLSTDEPAPRRRWPPPPRPPPAGCHCASIRTLRALRRTPQNHLKGRRPV